MMTTIINIYNSDDLPGEFLLQPLKSYCGFFATKIENSSNLKKCAWLITGVVSAIFVSIPLGVLAGIGMLIKLTGISEIKKHNQAEKDSVEAVRLGIVSSKTYATNSSSSIIKSGWKSTSIHQSNITAQNVDADAAKIYAEIDALTSLFKKAFVSFHGAISHGQGSVKVEVSINERVITV